MRSWRPGVWSNSHHKFHVSSRNEAIERTYRRWTISTTALKPKAGGAEVHGVNEPTPAERVRSLLSVARVALVSVIDADGLPLSGAVPMLADAQGAPVMVVSGLDPVSERARIDSRSAISVAEGAVSMQGRLEPVPGMQQIQLEEAFVERHPTSRAHVGSLDFNWWRFEAERVRLRDPQRPGGSDRWLPAADVEGAEPDPLAPFHDALVAAVNDSLGDRVHQITTHVGGYWTAEAATVVGIDRYGLRIEIVERDGIRVVRVPFAHRIDEHAQVHTVVAGLAQSAQVAAKRHQQATNDEPTVLALPVGS